MFKNGKRIALSGIAMLLAMAGYADSGMVAVPLGDLVITSLVYTASQVDKKIEEIDPVEGIWSTGEATDSIVQNLTSSDPIINGTTNRAISQASIAEGSGTLAGLKGYRYNNIGTVSNSLTFAVAPDGWKVGDVVSIVNITNYHDCVTIASISETTVTFTDDLPFSSIVAATGWDAKTAYVITKPEVGNVDLGYGAYAEGLGTKALNVATHAEGRQTEANGEYSHAEGSVTKAKALYSHAEGHNTEASGKTSHAEGESTKATAEYTHAEGHHTEAQGIRSHAEGNETKVYGAVGHAEGNRCVVGTTYSSNTLTPGNNESNGAYSHAEGNATLVTGPSAHAEGMQTFASKEASHAEGARTSATGVGSHCEGVDSTATGRGSHAEGVFTKAEGEAAHAEGYQTRTLNIYEHAEGRFNKSNKGDNTFGNVSNTLHSIGIGTSDSNRTNAVEVMQDGKVFIKSIGGYDGTNPTDAYVQDLATAIQQIIPISYASLKALRNSRKLTPRAQYCITNYVATTMKSYSRSANHPFDIIVTADSINKLNEVARAILHEGDTYFKDCNLSAWKVWYCLDNDTTRFNWAISSGKGVVYRLIDEWNNDVPYDFKGIQFWAAGDTDRVWRYTFDSGTDADNTDLSLSSVSSKVMNNIILPYFDYNYGFGLNKIVFKGNRCYGNTFGQNCQDCTFGSLCYCNTFGSDCSCIMFDSTCYKNSFGSGCHDIKLGDTCAYNSFGIDCGPITMGSQCRGNAFGNLCHNITFGENAESLQSWFRGIIIEDSNSYIHLVCSGSPSKSSPFRNVKIAQGVNNTWTYKTITDTNVGQTYQTVYRPKNSIEIEVE